MKLATLPGAAAAALLLSGCGLAGPSERPIAPAGAHDWRMIATSHDRQRLRDWRTAWVEALASANAAGHGAKIAREGALLQPDAALPGAAIPPGLYHCRVIKVGAKSEGLLDYIAYPAFTCRVRQENGLQSFAKLTGSQRPLGLLFPDHDRRTVFLGTLQLGDERVALEYGRDRERDMAGILERVGDQRWRLVFPYPHFESKIDVLELVPQH